MNVSLKENCKGDSGPPYMVPKEVWYLVDHLYRNALKTLHLFENPGLHSELIQIRNWLDTSPTEPLRILRQIDLVLSSFGYSGLKIGVHIIKIPVYGTTRMLCLPTHIHWSAFPPTVYFVRSL